MALPTSENRMYAFPNTPHSACTQAFAHALGLPESLCGSFSQSLRPKLLLAQAVCPSHFSVDQLEHSGLWPCPTVCPMRVTSPGPSPGSSIIIICQLNFKGAQVPPETQGVGPGKHCILQDGTVALPAQGRHSLCHNLL